MTAAPEAAMPMREPANVIGRVVSTDRKDAVTGAVRNDWGGPT
jgi:hypothetical protein